MHFCNPQRGERARFMMLYNSISSPPSRYFFEEPLFRVAPVLSRIVAGRAPKLTATLIVAEHSTAAYVVTIVTSRRSVPHWPEGAGGSPSHSFAATRFPFDQAAQKLALFSTMASRPHSPMTNNGRNARVDVAMVRWVRRWELADFPDILPSEPEFASNWPVSCLKWRECA